ncbi:glycosyltransferase family 1 protein [Nevskia sp.]|uniref:glycosyltransferase family 4 protein n=1 Tax=Nevskia sp. TaxID=1929292 RepID=UPI0025D295C6|nr:glycosyltransferase family 1 protein [Nevskia sp.]
MITNNPRLAFDGIIYTMQGQGGVNVYVNQLLARLIRDGVDLGLHLYEPVLARLPEAFGPSIRYRGPARIAERYRECRLKGKPALFHSSYYRTPSVRGTPTIVTVHDFIYERYVKGPRRWVHSWQKLKAIRQADAVICISESTRNDLMEFVGEIPGQMVSVIHNGVGEEYFPMDLGAGQDRPFVLFVGQRRGYKNFRAALEAMNELPDFDLVCVGGGALKPEELAIVPERVRQQIRHAGFVSDSDLNRLYNQAICLLYPSAYEGFGIPVLEAMRSGCPVVCGPCTAVQEVGGDALTVAHALDRKTVAAAIRQTLDADKRKRIVEIGGKRAAMFSWEKTYQRTADTYRMFCSDFSL